MRHKGFYHTMKSGLEYVIGTFLRDREEQHGFRVEYESEKIPYIVEGNYKPDFILTFADGRKRYIETKGYMDNEARRKMVAVRKANPTIDIRMLFARNHPIRKGAKGTYGDWADKVGYPWAVKDLPEDWLLAPI